MAGTTYGSALAEPQTETEEEVRLAYAVSNPLRWDTSTGTVQRIHDFLTQKCRDER